MSGLSEDLRVDTCCVTTRVGSGPAVGVMPEGGRQAIVWVMLEGWRVSVIVAIS